MWTDYKSSFRNTAKTRRTVYKNRNVSTACLLSGYFRCTASAYCPGHGVTWQPHSSKAIAARYRNAHKHTAIKPAVLDNAPFSGKEISTEQTIHDLDSPDCRVFFYSVPALPVLTTSSLLCGVSNLNGKTVCRLRRTFVCFGFRKLEL